MSIFGAILPQNELKLTDFPFKSLIVVKKGTFGVHEGVHNNSNILVPSNSCL